MGYEWHKVHVTSQLYLRLDSTLSTYTVDVTVTSKTWSTDLISPTKRANEITTVKSPKEVSVIQVCA